jgi:diphthamide synthase (EF-2-diphthine--ammonia ligase)
MVWSKRLKRKIFPFRDELAQAAQELSVRGLGPFYVLYSGGYDSEAILAAFLENGLPVVPIMVRYTDESNSEDFEHGLNYLAHYEMSPIIYEIDLAKWIHSQECRDLAEKVQAGDLATTAIYKAVLDMPQLREGFFIMGLHEPAIYAQDTEEKREWVLLEEEKWYAHHKFLLAHNLRGIGAFIHYSPELYTSFVVNPAYMRVYANMFNPELWQAEWVKHQLFSKYLRLERREKRTGFEAIQGEVNRINHEWIREHEGLWDRHYVTPVLDWVRGVGHL